MPRFQFDFSGYDGLEENEFFGYDFKDEEGREPTFDDIQKVLYETTPDELLKDWGMDGCLVITVVDEETGAAWSYEGYGWTMIRDRRLLPGEQRLFE